RLRFIALARAVVDRIAEESAPARAPPASPRVLRLGHRRADVRPDRDAHERRALAREAGGDAVVADQVVAGPAGDPARDGARPRRGGQPLAARGHAARTQAALREAVGDRERLELEQ